MGAVVTAVAVPMTPRPYLRPAEADTIVLSFQHHARSLPALIRLAERDQTLDARAGKL